MSDKVWRRPSLSYGPVAPTPCPSRRVHDLAAEGRRLALAGFHPRGVEVDPALRKAVGDARGELAEERVVRLLLDRSRGRPGWLASARRSEKHDADDRRGVDVRVGTVDAGDLLLQVKAGANSARKFKLAHGGPLRLVPGLGRVALVLARPEDGDDDVWWAAHRALAELRASVKLPR